MTYITISDVLDKVLNVDQATVDNANAFVDMLGAKYGVTQPIIGWKTKRLAVLKASVDTCLQYIGKDPIATIDGQETDIYKIKLEAYKQEFNELLASVQKSDFDGVEPGANMGIELVRA